MPLFSGDERAEKLGARFQERFEELREINQTTAIGASRLKDLSMALRTQSRQENVPVDAAAINDVVKESLLLVGGRTKQHQITEELGELPEITCFRSRIGQVVTNLLANAADALTEKKKLLSRSGDSDFVGQIHVATSLDTREGQDGIFITVSDNGDGVPESIREKIFEQFFTTKPAGVGTGLGLAMCVDIVKEHGGMLSVSDDESLGGARFELWLPVAPKIEVTMAQDA